MFVAKFSKDQSLVKFSDSSVSIIWGGSPKTYYIHAETTSLDMFKNRSQLRHFGLDHVTVIQVNPAILGRTLRGGSQDRTVLISVHRPNNKVQIRVEHEDSVKRNMTHTLQCEIKTHDDYNNMLVENIEKNLCRFDTRSYVENIHRFKHILDSFVKMNTSKIYIWSRQSDQGNDLTIQTKTQGSTVCVSLSDLEDGFAHLDDEETMAQRRTDAGVNIDTRKLAAFLSGLNAPKRSKVCFDIEHNKCLKITLDNEVMQGEKSYQSLLLIHSLNN